jgi:1,4-alpha-glucan branching enzyme
MRKTRPTASGTVRVTFELPAAVTAERVVLCGEFNDWSATATPMRQMKNGSWRATLGLRAGADYRYRFLVDGERWINDWSADAYLPNPFGGDDSVLRL